MKGLIIDEPWIGLILRGEKIWEMRKTACHHRGWIALIRKGSGQVVGIAEITDSLAAIESLEVYANGEVQHRIPSRRQGQAFADGWRTPWVLRNACALAVPVPYKHPFGAVIWVNLNPDVVSAVEAQANRAPSKPELTALDHHAVPPRQTLPRLLSTGQGERSMPLPGIRTEQASTRSVIPEQQKKDDPSPVNVRKVIVTGGNLRNGHLYLPLDFFPEDAIGGSNKSNAAARSISVTFSPGQTVDTDIDRTKRILRARSAVGDFFALADVREGDSVCLTSVGPYRYIISKDASERTRSNL